MKTLTNSLKALVLALCVSSSLSFAGIADEELTGVWKDPIVGWNWQVAAIAADWHHAQWSCPPGSVLPDQGTLRYAVKRMKEGVLGKYFKQYDITMAWTSEEFDWQSSMAVHVFQGFSRNVWKRDFLAVLCVTKP